MTIEEIRNRVREIEPDVTLLSTEYINNRLPELNLCIEVDGEQHFKPSKFSNISEEEANQNLEVRKEKDRQKDEYCLKNGIKLLRISYKSFHRQNKEYQEIIKNLFT